jgi:hypothetical protein
MALTGGLYWAGAPDAGSTRQQLLVSAPFAPNIRFTTCRFRGNYLLDGNKPSVFDRFFSAERQCSV